jgi:hypothetical protein
MTTKEVRGLIPVPFGNSLSVRVPIVNSYLVRDYATEWLARPLPFLTPSGCSGQYQQVWDGTNG